MLWLATGLWIGFLIYGVWLCIEDGRSASDDAAAARSREQKRSGSFERPEDCV